MPMRPVLTHFPEDLIAGIEVVAGAHGRSAWIRDACQQVLKGSSERRGVSTSPTPSTPREQADATAPARQASPVSAEPLRVTVETVAVMRENPCDHSRAIRGMRVCPTCMAQIRD